jgi:DNA end-binding protein Ku
MEQIVSGYEVAKGQYAVVDRQELTKLRPEADKAIDIDVFVHPDAIDPVYFTDRTYYLTPDGKAGQKPYAVLRKVMAEEGRYAVASMVLSGREQIVIIRPVETLLAVSVLSYDAKLKKPSAFADEVGDAAPANEEVKLARTLVEKSTTDDFDMSRYQDQYSGRLVKYLESKAGKKRVAAKSSATEEPAIINLMDALKQSIHAAKGAHVKHRRTAVHSVRAKSAGRRKTG